MQTNRLTNDPAEDIAPVSPFGAIDYGTTEDDLKRLAAQYSHITQVTNRKEYDAAQAAVTALVRARSKIEARRKELKAESLEFGRLVDSTAKSLIAVVTPEEQRIDAILEAVKRQKEDERKAKEAAEKARVDAILARVDEIVRVPSAHQRSASGVVLAAKSALELLLIDESFAEFQERAQEAKANALAELAELYSGALHDERIEAQAKAERERIAAEQRAESERLAKERAELEAIRRQNEAAQAEAARIERERADAERAEIARQQAELKAERDRIEAEKRADQQRIEREQRAAEEAAAKAEAEARIERLRPDAEKLEAFALKVETMDLPPVSPEFEIALDEVRAILTHASNQIREVASEARA